MGKLIVTEFVSLDGVMEAPGGEPGYAHAGWTMDYMEQGDHMAYKFTETLDETEAILLGRKTYEGFAAAWPGRDDPEGFAAKFNSMPKYVVSSTLKDPDWNNSHVLQGDPKTAIAKLKDELDGNLFIHGSCSVVHLAIENGLVDELRLMVFPTILGSGLNVFPEGPDRFKFKLKDAKPYKSGVVVLTYEPA
jgi:dihydrofolate reductase